MDIKTQEPLRKHTTMRLGGPARFMATATTIDDVKALYKSAEDHGVPVFILGGGSNVIAQDEGFNGIIILNRIKGFTVLSDDGITVKIAIGAGEVWDEVVERTVSMGLSGIEAMSAIPGTAGAAPVQNVGAYGQEIADTLVSVEAYDSYTHEMVTLSRDECELSYRNSIFRDTQQGRYCITSITLQLYHAAPRPPFYASLQQYLDERGLSEYTAQDIREAVIAIRANKLPDPAVVANSGSFFKNAIIESWQLQELRKQFPDMPSYDMPNGRHKVPTGWLIERAGLKGWGEHGMRVYDKNALVLVNESATSYESLAAVRSHIQQTVFDMFRIEIEQEPLEL